MLEAQFQRNVLARINRQFPLCTILKNDPAWQQGIPDILILFGNRWAMLEFKQTTSSARRANQEYFIDMFNQMSFARFVHPDNVEDVLHDLQQTFGATR